ncbi:MAG: 2-amino-4-hydroxy-6-hydroxymethyldihydropteridine diphosphokinase [Propionibacteriaceae bacterium]|jgi:dihydroneopterin aldolase/2-amino-4-hydroxy-6-hydroxymethyldihydropteridine diphosphokinase|nr:2-amino-4-hydroxy-6-hydroxymethyldihydropteridine diphosphokinase [Propionibacteriaceae bacterium]
MTYVSLSALSAFGHMHVQGISVWAHHGVFDFERRDGQEFTVDVDWWGDFEAPESSDVLQETIDYGQVASLVSEVVSGEPVDLIETLAGRVVDALLGRFCMEYVQVSVHKPHAPLEVEFQDVVYTTGVRSQVEQRPKREVVYSLGSNIEPRRAYLQFAVTALATTPGIENARVSPVYETAAVGEIEQDDFLNVVLIADTTMAAKELLHRGSSIEQLARRTRDVAHGPRTLDVDLIAVGDEQIDTQELTLPHPRAHERAFVLIPWLALNPNATLPGQGRVAPQAAALNQRIRPQIERLFLP